MKSTIKIFLRTDYTKKDGTNTVYLRLYIERQKKDFSLDIDVKPDLWNDKTQRVKKQHPHAKTINLIIEKQLIKAKEILLQAQLNEVDLTFEDFKKEFLGIADKQSFIAFAENMLKENTYRLAKETIKAYNSQMRKIKEYKENLSLRECNTEKFLKGYERHLKETKDNTSNTIAKALTFLRTVLNEAQKKGLIRKNVFENYKIKRIQTEKVYLSASELKALENLMNDKRLKLWQMRVLEYFLFSCYTGLRFQDVRNLKYSNIISKEVETDGQTEQKQFVKVLMHKTKNSTGQIVEIPLTDKAKKLAGQGHPDTNIFHTITSQPTNRYIKDIVKLADIDKKITFHSARHTFATHSLTLGMPIEVVSKLLGHSDIKQTQVYAKIVDSSKIKGMDKWND